MLSPSRRLFLFLCGVLLASPCFAQNDASLQQQLEALTARVNDLEKRLNKLESPELMQIMREATPPENPGDSKDTSNWERLKVGYDYSDVRDLLGEPKQIKKGGMEFWYYSDAGLKGPYVKFLFRKVNGWRAPNSKGESTR
jgi:hypothetical protein